MSPSIGDVRLALLWRHLGCSWPALASRLEVTTFSVDMSAMAMADERALRRLCRTATSAEREAAVRWLIELGPRPAPVTDTMLRAATTGELLGRVQESFPRMPRVEMEELIRRGSAVVADVVAVLRRVPVVANDPTALWSVVVAGEIGDPAAVDALARLLGHGSSEVAAAAAEALGRIGPSAVSALRIAATTSGDERRAVYAYGGLAAIHTDEVFAFLCDRLTDASEHGDLVAGALARHGRRAAATALRAQWRRAPHWMHPAFASAIDAVSSARELETTTSDWRVRYRRLPALGWAVPPSWVQVAALVRDRRRRADGRVPRLAVRRYRDAQGWCRVCARVMWRPLGLAVCAHTAPAVLGLQAALVRRWCDVGVPDVWAALDLCDDVDMGRLAPVIADAESPSAVVALARATLHRLAASRLEEMRAASEYVGLVSRDVRVLYDGRHDQDDERHDEHDRCHDERSHGRVSAIEVYRF